MTRLLVISDSHGSMFYTQRIAEIAERDQFDAVVHLGDGIGEARWLAQRLSIPVHSVAGNCDWDDETPQERILSLEGHALYMTHGHLIPSIRYDLTGLSYRTEERGADCVLYGHTHRANVEWVGNALVINPGALKDGRYADIEIDADGIRPRLMEIK